MHGPVYTITLSASTDMGRALFHSSGGGSIFSRPRRAIVLRKSTCTVRQIVVLKLTKKKELTPQEKEDPIGFCYRIRAMMAHIRAAKVHSWRPPVRYGILKGVIHLAKIEAPPKVQQEERSPIKEKSVRIREQEWLSPRDVREATCHRR